MAVRVRVRVRSLGTGSSITLVVLVNGGAESRKPTIVLGTEEARELGLYPRRPTRRYMKRSRLPKFDTCT